MQAIIRTIQNAFLNELQADKYFTEKGISDSFWEDLTNDLIGFQEDAKPIYTKIYSLNLENSEAIISKVPDFYALLIDEVAEKYVLDSTFQGAMYFIETKKPLFLKQVAYFKTLQHVITKVERNNLKLDLENGAEHLNFSVSEEEVEQVIKAQERQALKKKFAQWDKELEPTTPEIEPKKQTKVISLSWLKYAVAACLVLGLGFWLFETNTPVPETDNNTIVTTKPKDTTSKSPLENTNIPEEVIVYETKSIHSKLQHPSELGYTATDEVATIKIIYKDASKQINKLTQQLKIKQDKSIENQLNILKQQQGKYEFNGKIVMVYTNDFKMKIAVLTLDGKEFYVKKNENYFRIYFTKLPTDFAPVNDENSLDQLEKISFENE
ncbi:hypothetical protein [Flavobacterium branchiophilum]|uniref:Uncharacterized protein n=1 Tax=Flavobacterium branchiophilum TaxID=55197 RepID=A0A2H3KNE0_9FLAO|nr:hypothetical protein [Flavobacterium branchiophilum]PDS22363.1 hypothetical protein B0A77_13685 [Flavobacterium branchiophilum]